MFCSDTSCVLKTTRSIDKNETQNFRFRHIIILSQTLKFFFFVKKYCWVQKFLLFSTNFITLTIIILEKLQLKLITHTFSKILLNKFLIWRKGKIIKRHVCAIKLCVISALLFQSLSHLIIGLILRIFTNKWLHTMCEIFFKWVNSKEVIND